MMDEFMAAPVPPDDPVVIEDIIATYALRVYEARMEAEAQLQGLLPPPPSDRHAQAALRRARLRSAESPRTGRHLHLLRLRGAAA